MTNSNSKAFIGVSIVAVALFAGWALLGGQYRMVGVLKAAIAERDSIITERDEIMKNVDALYTQYDGRRQDIERFSFVVPDGGGVAEIISALDAIATRTGMQMTGVSVQGSSIGGEKQTSGALTIPVQLLGSYISFAAFLEGVEQNLRLLDVVSISISSDPTNPQLLRFDLQMTAYLVQ